MLYCRKDNESNSLNRGSGWMQNNNDGRFIAVIYLNPISGNRMISGKRGIEWKHHTAISQTPDSMESEAFVNYYTI